MPGPRLRGCAAWAYLRPRGRLAGHGGAAACRGLWAVFTVAAAGGQVLRNAMQKELTAVLGTVGATHVRFLFGLPFALLFLAVVLAATRLPIPPLNTAMIAWTVGAALAQIAATALLLATMQERSFVVTTAYVKTEPVQVAVFGLAFLGDKVTPRPGARHPDRHRRRAHRVLAAQQRRRGLLLEAGGARHRLGRAVCHCRHRLSRRHPGARRRRTSCSARPRRWCWASSSRR